MLKCSERLSALRGKAEEETEQRDLFQLYQRELLSIIAYGPGFITLSQTNLLKLDSVQNEAMTIILSTPRDTPVEAMRFMLDLQSIQARQKLEQVKAYLGALEDVHNPHHQAVKDTKSSRLIRGNSWIGQAEQSILTVCELQELKLTKEWEKYPNRFRHLYQTVLSENLGRRCRQWPAGKADLEVKLLIEKHSQPHDLRIYTDGSVIEDKSGWGFSIQQGDCTIYEDSAAYAVTSTSLRMEMEAVTHALRWIASRRDNQTTMRTVVVLSDCMNLLRKVKSGLGSPDWHLAMQDIQLEKLVWIYCPGHAGVRGNERADSLARKAAITRGLRLGKSEVLGRLRRRLQVQSQAHYIIERLEERGIGRGSARRSTLKGRDRAIFNQTNIGHVSKETLRTLLKDGMERIWAFPNSM